MDVHPNPCMHTDAPCMEGSHYCEQMPCVMTDERWPCAFAGREATGPLYLPPCGPGGRGLPHQPDERGYCSGCTGLFDAGREATPPPWAVEDDWTGLCEVCGDREAVVLTVWHRSKVTVRYCDAPACADDLRRGMTAVRRA